MIKNSYGLIIRQPYIGDILDDKKSWELRTANTNRRGLIYLIESGSGLIKGFTEIKDSIRLDKELYDSSFDKHRVSIPYEDCKWNQYAWVMQNTYKFLHPYRYQHPRGAVIWVRLSTENVPDIISMHLETISVLKGRWDQ